MPNLQPRGFAIPGLLAPTSLLLLCECSADMILIWSFSGTPSATLTMRGTSASMASRIAPQAARGGTKTAVAVGRRCCTAYT